ncbi:tautomerase family protein [Rhodanobacter lindaniclasticus]
MPLVRIDIKKHSDPQFARNVGRIVYESMRSATGIPDGDNFQILAEHDADHFVYDEAYAGITRTDGLVIIQITFNEGRTTEQKKRLYKAIAEGLHAKLNVRMEDVFVNLVEVKEENWSFGNGVAQYAD